jgi:mannose-1-phosphate guanylyltransferase
MVKFEMRPVDPDTRIQYIREEDEIKKGSSVKVTFFVLKPQKSVRKYKSEIGLEIWSEGKLVDKIKTNFIAPPSE